MMTTSGTVRGPFLSDKRVLIYRKPFSSFRGTTSFKSKNESSEGSSNTIEAEAEVEEEVVVDIELDGSLSAGEVMNTSFALPATSTVITTNTTNNNTTSTRRIWRIPHELLSLEFNIHFQVPHPYPHPHPHHPAMDTDLLSNLQLLIQDNLHRGILIGGNDLSLPDNSPDTTAVDWPDSFASGEKRWYHFSIAVKNAHLINAPKYDAFYFKSGNQLQLEDELQHRNFTIAAMNAYSDASKCAYKIQVRCLFNTRTVVQLEVEDEVEDSLWERYPTSQPTDIYQQYANKKNSTSTSILEDPHQLQPYHLQVHNNSALKVLKIDFYHVRLGVHRRVSNSIQNLSSSNIHSDDVEVEVEITPENRTSNASTSSSTSIRENLFHDKILLKSFAYNGHLVRVSLCVDPYEVTN